MSDDNKNDNLVMFCGRKLTELYGFATPEKIYEFLKQVCDKPEEFDIKDGQIQEQLKLVYTQFISLCGPNGGNYTDDNLKPAQHIYRKRTGEETHNPEYKNWSRFNVGKDWNHDGPDFWTTKYVSKRVKEPYWSHYDLLGLFLSLMGPAQEGATKLTFFLPLTAVYVRWCYIIGGKKVIGGKEIGTGIGLTPAIAQCTWRPSKGEKGGYEFCLGSSLAGYNFTDDVDNPVGSWQRRLQMGRFNLLKGYNNIEQMMWEAEVDDPNNPGQKKTVDVSWKFDNSPNISAGGSSKTHFGNCGETYPFLQVFDQWSLGKRSDTSGLALYKNFLNDKAMYKDIHIDKLTKGKWKERGPEGNKQEVYDYPYLWPPCNNCKYLLEAAGFPAFKQTNFQPITGVLDKPPDKPPKPWN
ncbi:hypothetical protein FCOIX_13392 [Fusarium coicis]|nr:hypothetical protein FCOIX_13392 [Fusarium coicis]